MEIEKREAIVNFNESLSSEKSHQITELWLFFRTSRLLLLVVFVSNASAFLLGYNLSVFNTILPVVISDFGWCKPTPSNALSDSSHANLIISPEHSNNDPDASFVQIYWTCHEAIPKQSILQGCVMLGAALGSVWSGSLLIWFGRRMCLLILNIGFICGGIISALSTSLVQLSLGRAITGVITGLATVVPSVYLEEMAPPLLKSSWSFLPSISVNFGILVGILVGTPITLPDSTIHQQLLTTVDWSFDRMWWRVMLFLPVVVCLFTIYILFMYCTFETPEFLRISGSGNAAIEIESLIWPRHLSFNEKRNLQDHDVTKECVKLNGIEYISETISDHKPPSKSNSDLTCSLDKKVGKISIMRALYRHSVLRQELIIGWLLSILHQLTGINAFACKSSTLFLQAGLPFRYITLASASMAFLGLFFSCLVALMINSISRRKVFVWGILGMAISLLPSAICEYIVKPDSEINGMIFLISTFFFISIFSCSYGPGMFLYLNELWPAEVKETALSIAFGLNWLSCLCIILISDGLSQSQSMKLFSGLCFLGTIFVYFFIRETKTHSDYQYLNSSSLNTYKTKYVHPETELATVP